MLVNFGLFKGEKGAKMLKMASIPLAQAAISTGYVFIAIF
jgi:hypothetical protein